MSKCEEMTVCLERLLSEAEAVVFFCDGANFGPIGEELAPYIEGLDRELKEFHRLRVQS